MTTVAMLPAEVGQRAARMPAGRVRLAVFTSHPIQYQAPLFRALAASERIAPTVYFGSRHGLDVAHDTGFGAAFRWDVPLLDGYDHVFLPNVARRPDVSRFGGVRVRGLGRSWRRQQHDAALVLGWQTWAHLQALGAAWRHRLPVLVRGESTLAGPPPGTALHRMRRGAWLRARRAVYRAAFAGVDAFLVIGTRNREYYRAFGVSDAKLFWAPYGVDNEWFALGDAARVEARARIRHELGAGPRTLIFASSAKLIERKRPHDLLEAVARLRRLGTDARALFIGDGAERQPLERAASGAGIADAVTITGFVNQRELPGWYAAADALVLPSDSRETWGLVVNEAMAASLPVVVSDAAGCAPDLVREGVNGFTYPCGDVAALTDRLARLAWLSDGERRCMGIASYAIVRHFSLARVVEATERALDVVLDARAGKAVPR